MRLPIPFNNPTTYKGHSGVDYGQPEFTPFRASDSGVVSWLGKNASGGYFIWVKYDSIAPRVGYHHMPSHAGCPRVGSRFSRFDQLGLVGNTGNSTGPHLHSEVEGYGTTQGYWKFFDPNNVLTESEDDMPLDAKRDYPAFEAMLQRAIKFGVRPNGAGADWKLGPTIWERLNQIEAAVKVGTKLEFSAEDAKLIADAIPGELAERVIDALKNRL